MSELDVMGTLRGTDKCSSHLYAWDYLRHYEELFSRWRHSNINLIEIGVDGGESLTTWRWFFEKATLAGIDPDCLRFAGNRTVVKIGSQEDPSFLHVVAYEYPPKIVIDDGLHIGRHMITSFETLFPQLRPGGIYIFEDMSFHFEEGVGQWKRFKKHQGLAETSLYDYLSRFVRARSADLDSPNSSWRISRYVFEHSAASSVSEKERHAISKETSNFSSPRCGAGANNNIITERYAQSLVKHNVNQERAAVLLGDVLKVDPNNAPALTTLFSLLIRLARSDEAAEAAETLTRLYPMNPGACHRLADMQCTRKRPDLELLALKKLLELAPEAVDVWARLLALQANNDDH